jgi:hypothetical protein
MSYKGAKDGAGCLFVIGAIVLIVFMSIKSNHEFSEAYDNRQKELNKLEVKKILKDKLD